jgi:hypothetical protein
MAASRTSEGAKYANFLPGALVIADQATAAFSRTLLFATVQNISDKSAMIPATGNRFIGLRGEEGGRADERAVVVTPILTMVGVEPETITGAAGPVQVAFAGAPLQEMVTLIEPLPPVSASCSA